jgi:hypothetical protein
MKVSTAPTVIDLVELTQPLRAPLVANGLISRPIDAVITGFRVIESAMWSANSNIAVLEVVKSPLMVKPH